MDFMDMVVTGGAWSLLALGVVVAHHRLRERSKDEARRLRVLDLTGWRGGRGFTLIEAMIVVAIAGIVLVIVATNVARCGDGKTEMQRCAEQCGEYARPALLPSGFYGGVTCSCLPTGTQAVPYPMPVERP